MRDEGGKGKAVFLDRDGVLNRLVFNPATGAYESPHRREDLELLPGVEDALRALLRAGFSLYLVSNQPSFAKGKATMEELEAIQRKMQEKFEAQGIVFQEYNYCYHHPESVVESLKGPCQCRKPSPFFIQRALARDGLQKEACWMVGDRDADILCGTGAGVRTVLLDSPEPASKKGSSSPDFKAASLALAVEIILSR